MPGEQSSDAIVHELVLAIPSLGEATASNQNGRNNNAVPNEAMETELQGNSNQSTAEPTTESRSSSDRVNQIHKGFEKGEVTAPRHKQLLKERTTSSAMSNALIKKLDSLTDDGVRCEVDPSEDEFQEPSSSESASSSDESGSQSSQSGSSSSGEEFPDRST